MGPDAGQVGDKVDPVPTQLPGRPDAGQHEQLRRSEFDIPWR
jgi:hypothetical protein